MNAVEIRVQSKAKYAKHQYGPLVHTQATQARAGRLLFIIADLIRNKLFKYFEYCLS